MIASSEIAERFADGRRFVSGLKIRDLRNTTRSLAVRWPEQDPWLDALLSDDRYVIGLKPRQVGYTTITVAVMFWLAFTAREPWLGFSMAHEDGAVERLRQMVTTFYEKLPRRFQRGLDKDNLDQTRFAHNGAGLNRAVAGGRGQGRSWTYNWFHGTEMAFWPGGTAQAGGADDEAGDAASTAFASVTATVHDERGKIVLESTGNGPQGPFYGLWGQACEPGSRWRRVFVPWTSVERYCDALTDAQARELEADLDDDEKALVAKLGLTLGQIAWRRRKMRTENWTPLRFRREYPATDQDPFLVTMAGWFDADRLNAALAKAPPSGDTNDVHVRFLPYEPGRRYFIGADTSGGVKRDSFVLHVLRDDLAHAARVSSNTIDPIEQARWVDRMSDEYGHAVALIEANKYGTVVIGRTRAPLWKSAEGKDFWSTGDKAGATKLDAFSHARELVMLGHAAPKCSHTIRQMLRIVQKQSGKIEGAGNSHDDYAMAYVLALYNARHAWRRHLEPPGLGTPDRMRAMRRRFGHG